MIITIDIQKIIDNFLSLDHFIYLNHLYLKSKDEENADLLKVLSSLDDSYLQDMGFIKITESGNVLRSKGIELFEGKGLFHKFIATFPIKTPKGRYLSPVGTDGIVASSLKKKWTKLFKNNVALEQKAIKVLEAEIEFRLRTNAMEFMQACEAWLNGASYEKYEYLLEENEKESLKYLNDSL